MNPQLLHNDGRGRFEDVSASAGDYFLDLWLGRGVAAADFDDDGDLDMLVSHWIAPWFCSATTLRLDGTSSASICGRPTESCPSADESSCPRGVTAGRCPCPGRGQLSECQRRTFAVRLGGRDGPSYGGDLLAVGPRGQVPGLGRGPVLGRVRGCGAGAATSLADGRRLVKRLRKWQSRGPDRGRAPGRPGRHLAVDRTQRGTGPEAGGLRSLAGRPHGRRALPVAAPPRRLGPPAVRGSDCQGRPVARRPGRRASHCTSAHDPRHRPRGRAGSGSGGGPGAVPPVSSDPRRAALAPRHRTATRTRLNPTTCTGKCWI